MTRPLLASELPSELIAELARGVHPPAEVASWFGLDEVEWERLSQWTPLRKAVDAKKAEYERDGLSTQLKARMMYGAVLDRAFIHAMKDDASFRSIMDFLEHTATVADVKPKQQQVANGTGFSITINVPGSITAPQAQSTPVTIDMTEALTSPPPYLLGLPIETLEYAYEAT